MNKSDQEMESEQDSQYFSTFEETFSEQTFGVRNGEQVLVNTEYLAKQVNDLMTQQINKDKINKWNLMLIKRESTQRLSQTNSFENVQMSSQGSNKMRKRLENYRHDNTDLEDRFERKFVPEENQPDHSFGGAIEELGEELEFEEKREHTYTQDIYDKNPIEEDSSSNMEY